MCKCKCKGAASSKGPRGPRGLKGDSGDSETPKMYRLIYFNDSTYDLDISTMGVNCLGIVLENIVIDSLTLPAGNDIFNFILLGSTVVFTTTFDADLSVFTELKYISISTTTNIDIAALNMHLCANLTTVQFTTVTSVAGAIGNFLSTTMTAFSFSAVSGITAIGNVTSPLTGYAISSCSALLTLGNVSGISGTVYNVSSNVVLTTVGNVTGNTFSIWMYINGNTLLTTIGSLANNTITGTGSIIVTNNPALTTVGSLLGTTIASNAANAIDFRGNALSAATISQILIDFDANGQSNKQINLSGGTNAAFGALTVGGAAAHAALLVKGWTITMN